MVSSRHARAPPVAAHSAGGQKVRERAAGLAVRRCWPDVAVLRCRLSLAAAHVAATIALGGDGVDVALCGRAGGSGWAVSRESLSRHVTARTRPHGGDRLR